MYLEELQVLAFKSLMVIGTKIVPIFYIRLSIVEWKEK